MKKKKKGNTILDIKLISISIVIIALISSLVISFTYSRKTVSNIPYENSGSDGFFTKITPTIIPSENSKKIFIHPIHNFTFEYPDSWQLIVDKHINSTDWYDVTLTDPEENNEFRINFMHQGRGGPYYEYETNEEKIINGRRINWKIMYKDNKAFEAVVSFPDEDFGHKLIGLYIYLPKDNQAEFIQKVEELIATLE